MAARRYIEGARDEEFRNAVAMWDHPHRVLARDLTNVDTLFSIGEVSGNPSPYVVPNTKMLRGLQELHVITEANFLPSRFKKAIIERHTLYPGGVNTDKNYALLTYRRVHNEIPGSRSAYIVMLPQENDDGSITLKPVLDFPMNDVYDLPAMVFMYILFVLNEVSEGGVLHAEYCIDPKNDIRRQFKVANTFTKNRANGSISLRAIITLYNDIMSSIYTSIHGFDHIAERCTWNGSDDSGTRIICTLKNGGVVTLRVELALIPGIGVRAGGRWTEAMKMILDEWFPSRCYLTTSNEEDDLCLVYCLILGVMCRERQLWVTRVDKVIPPDSVICRGVYDCDIESIQSLCKSLLEGENPLKDCDIRFGVEYSIKEMQERLTSVESKLLSGTLEKYGLDVYVFESGVMKHVFPVYMSKREKLKGRIPILCVQDGKGKGHYILVTDMDTIMARTGGKIFYNCSKCGAAFYSKGALMRHVHNTDEVSEERMHWSRSDIGSDAIVKGRCWKCMLQFATDFEYQYHTEHCFMEGKSGYRYVRCENSVIDLPTLRGVDVDIEAEKKKNDDAYLLYADFESYINPETGEHDIMSWGLYDLAKDEYLSGFCLGDFIRRIYEVSCERAKTHVYFHNAMNYDGNFILRYVLRHDWTSEWEVHPIMKSSSRLQKLSFRFKGEDGHSHTLDIGDTFLFLTMSLERIVNCIRRDGDVESNKHNFPHFFEQFTQRYGLGDEEVDMILRKNLFPYKYFTAPRCLDVPIEDFLKIFNGENPEDVKFFSENVKVEDLKEQYPLVKKVMDTFKCKTARDYHDIYLMCDVMELADVFTRSIETLWESHHVFLPNYIGMPAASWAAFLRHNPRMEIPLYSATVYAEFFSSMTRGGVTSAPLRYAKSDETHSIIYLDVNGLYPYVMQAYDYPSGYMIWMTFNSIPDDVSCNDYLLNEIFPVLYSHHEGMCLTVDLHYTEELKRETDDFPFAPEHRVIYDEYFDDNGELGGFLRSWSEANQGEKMHAFTGLVGTLYDKQQYTVHWRLLEWYIRHGLIVTKIWWGVRFEESDYLASYVRKNIEIRNTRKDELGKMVYKLMGNSIYGKTFESPFKRGTYNIVRDKTVLAGLLEEGGINTITPIDDLAWVVKMDGTEIILDKPTYIGACVCEYAKMHMYELFYDKLRPIFESVQLVYTDTDSVIVYITHPPEMHEPARLFEYIKTRCPGLIGNIGGQVKSEIKDANGEDDIIDEVIALRSKVYAYKARDGHIGKRAKGTTHAAQEGQLDWDVYEKALQSRVSATTVNVQFIRSRFTVSTKEVERQSLSANDGKREICVDGIHTHAWGY